MSVNPDEILSAQVIMRSASGQSLKDAGAITAENIDMFAPLPETAARVEAEFQSLGFSTGPLVGISFSITGSASQFEKVFGTTLCRTDDEGVACLGINGTVDLEFPLDKLRQAIARDLHAVTFTPPAHYNALQ